MSLFRPRRKYSHQPRTTFSFFKKRRPNLIRFETHTKRSRRRRIYLGILGAILLMILYWIFFHSPYFDIKRITARGDTALSAETATAILTEFLGQNIFLASTADMKDRITTEYPTIQDLSLVRLLPDGIRVEASDFKVAWVLTYVNEGIAQRFLLNTAGFITEPATSENAIDLPVLELVSDTKLSAKEEVLPPEFLNRILELDRNIQSRFNLKTLKFKMLDTAREIHLLLNNNWVLKFTIDQDWDGALVNLSDILRGQDISTLEFDYIDLRIPDKIFLKEK